MADLHPTPTRLALLQDVADGLIVAEPSSNTIWRDERLAGFYDPFTATRTRVTAKARELEDVEWIELGGKYSYRLTDRGRELLAVHRAEVALEQRCQNCAPGYDCESGIYTRPEVAE